MKLIRLLLSLTIVVAVGWMVSTQAGDVVTPGQKLYDAKCAMCHGKAGVGSPAMSKALGVAPEVLALNDGTKPMTEAEEIAVSLKGKGKMKAVAGLTEADAKAIVAYTRSLASVPAKAEAAATAVAADVKKEATATIDLVKVGATYKAKCASCHGAKGEGNAAMVNVFKVDIGALAVNDKATLDKSDAELNKLTADGVGKMPAYKGKLTEQEIADLTTYIRQLAASK